MHRFFVDPAQIEETSVTLLPPQAHQIAQVLRMQPGYAITVLDNAGWLYEVQLTAVSRKRVRGHILQKRPVSGEPTVQLTLFQALLKRDNFEWVLQKGTELGVSQFVPLWTAHTVVSTAMSKPSKQARWQRILTAAAAQSRRGYIPTLRPAQSWADATANLTCFDCALIAWAGAVTQTVRQALATMQERPSTIALFVGPEGGFAEDEVTHPDLFPVTLGPRILRAETAAVAATTLVMDAVDSAPAKG